MCDKPQICGEEILISAEIILKLIEYFCMVDFNHKLVFF